MNKESSFFTNPFLDVDQFIQIWRQKRADHVGLTICRAGVFLALAAVIVGIVFSNAVFWKVHLLVLLGCVVSLVASKKKKLAAPSHFIWWPAYLGYWLSSFGTFYTTGGISSPFLSLVLIGLYVVGVIIQTRFRQLFVFLFIGSNILFWMIFEMVHPISYLSSQQNPVFISLIHFLGIGVLVTCIIEMLRTEQNMAQEILDRYRELNVANQRLEKEEVANAAKTTFLANVSHELRTPLGAILGYTDLLRDRENSAPDQTKFIDTIRRNGQQLSKLVDDLLDLTKVQVGKIEIENIEFSFHQILSDVFDLLSLSARRKKLNLQIQFQNPIPEKIISDPLRVKQVLMNLVGNALKFTEQGGVTLQVQCELNQQKLQKSEGGLRDFKIAVSIKDTGQGISAEEQTMLFRPFSQANASMARKFGGTGLGLSLSRELAKLLGGDLILSESRKGQGSVFVFSFAAKASTSNKLISHFGSELPEPFLNAKKSAKIDPVLKDLRVLIVDDLLDNQNLIRAYLQPAGAVIETAVNGLEGVQKAAERNYQVILMDIQMPVLDGLSAVKRIREQNNTSVIVALTAHAKKEDEASCLQAGCDGYLTKPIHRYLLIDTIKLQLDRKRSLAPQPELMPPADATID